MGSGITYKVLTVNKPPAATLLPSSGASDTDQAVTQSIDTTDSPSKGTSVSGGIHSAYLLPSDWC